MKQGYLSGYFTTVAVKRLSAVEANPAKSNQHEFNGTRELKAIFGTNAAEKANFQTQFIWFGEENEAVSSDSFVTWYDARYKHATRSEFRLYFATTDVSELAREGDLMIVAMRPDRTVMIIITAAGSTTENQLLWLFGIEQQEKTGFTLVDLQYDDRKVDFAVRFILEELGIDVEEPETDYLDSLLNNFKGTFPKTSEFSKLARASIRETINPVEEPDKALMAWMDHEEKLFRRLERQIVEKRLQSGFENTDGTDVEGFITFSLSVQNRRKSRAGLALENHLEEIFNRQNIKYSRTAETENRSKPDFLFPGAAEYHDHTFNSQYLTMLGVKTTCKDRWRQVLSEARKIDTKHLFTLEPGISNNQTEEMKANNLYLVLPAPIHSSYQENQKSWLLTLADFIQIVAEKENSSRRSFFIP